MTKCLFLHLLPQPRHTCAASMSTEELSPELVSIATKLCSIKHGNVAAEAKQRASRQIQSYLQVLRLRLQKDECRPETLAIEHDSMLFIQNLRRFKQH